MDIRIVMVITTMVTAIPSTIRRIMRLPCILHQFIKLPSIKHRQQPWWWRRPFRRQARTELAKPFRASG